MSLVGVGDQVEARAGMPRPPLLCWALVDQLLLEHESALRESLDWEYRMRYGELVGNRCWAIYRALSDPVDARVKRDLHEWLARRST